MGGLRGRGGQCLRPSLICQLCKTLSWILKRLLLSKQTLIKWPPCATNIELFFCNDLYTCLYVPTTTSVPKWAQAAFSLISEGLSLGWLVASLRKQLPCSDFKLVVFVFFVVFVFVILFVFVSVIVFVSVGLGCVVGLEGLRKRQLACSVLNALPSNWLKSDLAKLLSWQGVENFRKLDHSTSQSVHMILLHFEVQPVYIMLLHLKLECDIVQVPVFVCFYFIRKINLKQVCQWRIALEIIARIDRELNPPRSSNFIIHLPPLWPYILHAEPVTELFHHSHIVQHPSAATT